MKFLAFQTEIFTKTTISNTMSHSRRYRKPYKTRNSIRNSISFKINKQRVDDLLKIISKARTTTVLHQLEYYREKLSIPTFRILLSTLTTELNSKSWKEFLNHRKKAVTRRMLTQTNRCPIISIDEINHCCQILFYYIVSVINKYKIPSTETLWNEILTSSLTKNKQFYDYLYKNKINLPSESCELFSKTMRVFYPSQSDADKIKLIALGLICNGMITSKTKIKHLEKLFFELKQREILNEKILKPENFISLMNTPEKLSLFLSYFPDYDINQVNETTQTNVLEQVMNMKPYFYLPQVDTNILIRRFRPGWHGFLYSTLSPLQPSSINPHPNEILKYRAVRIINLLQQLICRDAQLSKPIYAGILTQPIIEHRFFTTSIGIYVIISLSINNIYPNNHFVSFIIKYLKRFDHEFQNFMLHHLALTYSIVHKSEFILQQRNAENEQEQEMHDILFQRTIKLKEWCRLKINDHCSRKNIQELNLSKSLINYCSFGVFDPNYALHCIREVITHKGNTKPKQIRYENENYIIIDAESSADDYESDNDV